MTLTSLVLRLAFISALLGAGLLAQARVESALLPNTAIVNGVTSVQAGSLCHCKTKCLVKKSCTAAVYVHSDGTCKHDAAAQADIVLVSTAGTSTWLKFGVYVPQCLTAANIPCTNSNNGMFYMHPTDCSKYLVCANGYIIVMPCPVGLVFNIQSHTCSYPPIGVCKCQTTL